MKNEGDDAVDINSLSENVLLVSRGRFQKMAPNLFSSSSCLMWVRRIFSYHERASILCLCWITVSLKNGHLGNYFPPEQTRLSLPYLTCIRPECINSSRMQLHFSSLHRFFTESPFLQLSAFFSLKIAESLECGRIGSQPADWIVFCSVSGCIKKPRMYKNVMDASSSRLDRSELTSAEGKRGTKQKREPVIYWPPGWKQSGGWMPLSSHGWQPQM